MYENKNYGRLINVLREIAEQASDGGSCVCERNVQIKIDVTNSDITDVKKFLNILSMVMNEENPVERLPGYNELYSLVNNDLFSLLSKSNYPDAPALMKKLNTALDEIEFLGIVKELIGTNITLLTSADRQSEMNLMERGFGIHLPKVLRDIHHDVPFIFYHCESSEIQICAINYADIRIPLDLREYSILTDGCQRHGIRLSELVNVFVVGCDMMPISKCCILSGNDSKIPLNLGTIDKMYYLESSNIRRLINFGNYIKLSDHTTPLNDCISGMRNEEALNYSFKDRFESILSEIDIFYNQKLTQAKYLTIDCQYKCNTVTRKIF